MANLKYIGKNILNHDLILKKGNVSGSASSTGSFGNLNISSDASIAGDMVVGGKLTAQEIHTEIESASIIFTSGSTLFGNSSDDTHEFTGSLKVTETGSFGELEVDTNATVDGDLKVAQYIKHKGDENTFINFTDNRIRFKAGDIGFFDMEKDASTPYPATINPGGNRINFRVMDRNTELLLKTDSEAFNVGLYHAGNKKLETKSTGVDVTGSLDITGSLTTIGNISGLATSTGSFGHLVVQGNITASGTVRADAFESVTGGNAIDFKDSLNITGNLTASGDLSIDDLTASGNISGSSTSTGSFGQINTAGNVGLGITNVGMTDPAGGTRTLHIHKDGSNSAAALRFTTGDTGTALQDGLVLEYWDGAAYLWNYENTSLGFATNSTQRMTILGGGNIGIGEGNPDTKLEVAGAHVSGKGIVHIDSTDHAFIALDAHNSSHNKGIYFQENGVHQSILEHEGANNRLRIWDGSTTYVTIGDSTGDIHTIGNISGSATSTGSFGLVLQNGSELSTFLGAAGTETLFSGSAASTGSFGRVEVTSGKVLGNSTGGVTTPFSVIGGTGTSAGGLQFGAYDALFGGIWPTNVTPASSNYALVAKGSRTVINSTSDIGLYKDDATVLLFANSTGVAIGGNSLTPSHKLDVTGTGRFTGNLTLGGNVVGDDATNILGVNDITALGDISGSATSTGSFGRLDIVDNVSATSFTGIFNGALSGSAQIASNISGAFAVASASFAADILSNSSSFATRITVDSSSFSTRVTNLKTDSGSFSTRVTKNEGTGSKILNGQLEFTNITGSGHISMSLSSTGSFGRVSATTLGGHSPLSVDSITTFTNVITASSAVQLDGKVFIQTGSIEGDLHVRTNENLMRIGKSTSGLIVSGSEEISRFATGSDGSIIDLGFTVIDEDGIPVLAGDGDGIHIDSNNYWYNNKFYKVGDGSRHFLQYDTQNGIRYKGEVTVQTGSFGGEMFINSPTGSMFIGKFTGGIPSSGSDNVSRFATGSDGSIIDLGFTTTNEDGETVFLTTGDGVVVDSNNYWYTTGHFKVGNADKNINWDTKNLTLTKVTASGDFFIQGDSYVQEYIYHKGDNDTYLRFAPNLVNLVAGGKSAIKYDASTGKVIINNSNANVDFHVMADDGEEILATDAANNRVGINTTTPGVALEVVGDISGSAQSTGSFGSLVVDGSSLDFSNVPTSDPGIAGRVWRDGTDLKISVG